MRSNETIIVLQTMKELHNKLDLLAAQVSTLTDLVHSLQEGVTAWGEPLTLDDLFSDASSDASREEEDYHTLSEVG